MSDDAAQDKKTEDDSIAEADAQGSASADQAAEQPEPTKETAAAEPKADEPVAEPKAEPAEKPAPAAESKPTDERKSSALGSKIAVPMVALIALGVLLVAALAGLAAFAWQSHSKSNELADRDSASKAACDFAKAVSVYDQNTWNDFGPRVQALITGEFKQMFDPMAGDVKDILSQAHAKSSLNVLRCGWESGDSNKATVLVSLTQTSTNDFHNKPIVLTIPTYVELEKHDGKWLVSKFQPVYSGDENPLFPGASGGGNDQQGGAQPSGQPAPSTTQAPQPAPTSAAPKPGN
ncbi:hypothetical protein VMT65_34040 [Nocardia sp. CDC153]|uniref:hypothetical protein n=1 Tax=Nocardia sp. CDC153 TaxID=3112167 RepID=UPI002DBE9125|nr:hypothetical protein [Nocardia sp. CDC153]MEC3958099.1 hypothetical protein [Nocardia sp. CDC153]